MRIINNKMSIIIFLLILVLCVSVINSNQLNDQVERLETVVIMEEFSQLARKWRNFNNFTKELVLEVQAEGTLNSIQVNGYRELGLPQASVILESSNLNLKSEYRPFIIQFNKEFNMLYDRFFRRLPDLTVNELEHIHRILEAEYVKFINSGDWVLDQDGKNTVLSFEMNVLDEVLKEIIEIKNQLE